MKKFVVARKDLQTRIKLGNVGYHKELLRPGEGCHGGGEYVIDVPKKTVFLYGLSGDYGRPHFWKDTQKPEGMEDYDFFYRMELQDIGKGNCKLDIGGTENEEIELQDFPKRPWD